MSRLLLAPALVVALGLAPSAARAQKVFYSPTTSGSAVAGGGVSADYALTNSTIASTKVQAAGLTTHVQAGPTGTATSAAVDAANIWKADVFVSVSSNAGGGHGYETYFHSTSTPGQTLASRIQTGLNTQYALTDRGTKSGATSDGWYVLKTTTMPAVVTYVLFHDCTTAHPALPGGVSESAFLRSASGQNLIASGLASGTCAYFNKVCGVDCGSIPESCDGADNNCNGQTDEGNPGGGGACVTTKPGVCSAGINQCQGGTLVCVQTTQSSSESCNSKDDDCDGSTDEGNPGGGAACDTGRSGVCAPGTMQCQSGALACVQNVQASTESCNNKDDDCDGQIDDGDPGGGAACTVPGKVGVCAAGVQHCQAGAQVCTQTTQPALETCNGKDDNCNGSTDENDPGGGGTCDTGKYGICSAGINHCQAGKMTCVQSTQAATSDACNGLDDDCDGQTDENDPGSGVACDTKQQGICAAGTRHCMGGTLVCSPNNLAESESCDGLDNDCNGVTDDPPICTVDAGMRPDAAMRPDASPAGPDASPAGPDASPAGPDASEPPDAGAGVPPDASRPRDAAVILEPNPDGGGKPLDGGSVVAPQEEGGCGCAAGGESISLTALLAFGAPLLRRRRRS